MTIDPFRKFQKSLCPNTYGRKKRNRSIYGCSCCRPRMSLNEFKKMTRKLAKAHFRQETAKIIHQPE